VVRTLTIDLTHCLFAYCRRAMLKVHKSDGLGDLGAPEWHITLCLLLAYIILYFALWKGVKTVGKVCSQGATRATRSDSLVYSELNFRPGVCDSIFGSGINLSCTTPTTVSDPDVNLVTMMSLMQHCHQSYFSAMPKIIIFFFVLTQ